MRPGVRSWLLSMSVVVSLTALASPPTPWSRAQVPALGPARSIGAYGAGCITGAVALPLVGEGFAVARPERHRVFGHPLLVALLERVGQKLAELHWPALVVGDLGQPRGGPAPTGHASHQTGLDVDLYFLPSKDGRPVSLVDAAHQRPTADFNRAARRLLTTVVANREVERIFLNPILKRALCSDDGDHAWLRKVRPWWGHDDHFHVRLACPADSPQCTSQAALPDGDGCSELAWWFDTKAQAARAKEHGAYAAHVGSTPTLPAACSALIESKD